MGDEAMNQLCKSSRIHTDEICKPSPPTTHILIIHLYYRWTISGIVLHSSKDI